jgi:peptide/nickel transport system ATP-binding protein
VRDADLLQVDGLSVQAPRGNATATLLAGVSFTVSTGEIVGLVGESGSGKTLTGLSILGLLPGWARVQGRILFKGEDLLRAPTARRRAMRGSEVSMIFQEPRAALNPSLPVGRQITDVLRTHLDITRRDAVEQALAMLAQVGLPQPKKCFSAYTHELSGGMCQRVMIAMSLACGPDLLIADEPTTALDVTIQAQIMDLLRRLARERHVAILLISHNLAVVAALCDRVVTLYSGEVVNIDSKRGLLTKPKHPYVRSLLDAVERRGESVERPATQATSQAGRQRTSGHGCRYSSRCPFVVERCRAEHPALEVAGDGSATRCCRRDEIELRGITE